MLLVPVRLSSSRPSAYRLSQGASLSVVVVDPRGTPWADASVTLQGRAMPEQTNSSGVATFSSVPAGEAVVQIRVGGYTLRARGTTDETLFVTVPVCAPGPILTGTEIVALIVGASAVLGGLSYKKRAAEVFGEIILGGAIFNAIWRNSCRW